MIMINSKTLVITRSLVYLNQSYGGIRVLCYHNALACSPSIMLSSCNFHDDCHDDVRENWKAKKIMQNLLPDDVRQLKALKLWYGVLALEHPEKALSSPLTDEQWLKLLNTKKTNKRKIMIREFKAMEMESNKRLMEIPEDLPQSSEPSKSSKLPQPVQVQEHIVTAKESLTLKFRKTMIKTYRVHQIMEAKKSGNKIIFDLSYFENTRMGSKQLAQTMSFLLNSNLCVDREPLHMVFCNSNLGTQFLDNLPNYLFQGYDIDLLATVTDKCYLDLFPKEDIVYVLRGGKHIVAPTMKVFNPSHVYVFNLYHINARYDKIKADVLNKGVRIAKLPHHLHSSGVVCIDIKYLNDTAMVKLLSTLYYTKCWTTAMNTINNAGQIRDRNEKISSDGE